MSQVRRPAGAGLPEPSAPRPGAGAARRSDPHELEVGGRRVSLSSLDKVLWPKTGFTKSQLVDYYLRVAPALLPHIAGRALTLGRFPDGVDGVGFAQTECRGRPAWLPTKSLKLRSGETRNYCVVDDVPSLAWVANLGTIELHPFLARATLPERPTAVVFDIDPGAGVSLSRCCRVALLLRETLAAVGLRAFSKTSGSSGLHVYVPVRASYDFGRTKGFARDVAGRLATEHPALVTDAPRSPDRAGKVLIDWGQNAERRSTIAAYSLRATDRPAVSTPVSWSEMEEAAASGGPSPLDFPPEAVLDRVDRDGDLFGPVLELQQELPR